MLRLHARQTNQIQVNSQQDQVLCGWSLPSDTVIHDFRAKIDLIGTVDKAVSAMIAYALEAWILPVIDPDTPVTLDGIVDALVPKDTDVQTMDLDTAAADTTPFWEPGEADWSSVLDIGLQPERIWHSHKFQTVATPGVHIHQDNQTPFSTVWLPIAQERVHVRRRLRVRQPSVLVLACSAPSLDDTTATLLSQLVENEWGRIKYMGDMLKQAHMDLLGITEAGAETPWEDATDLLQKHLLPDMVEETADSFETNAWNTLTEATLDHSVVGELGTGQISLA